jgi:hypothetical protein
LSTSRVVVSHKVALRIIYITTVVHLLEPHNFYIR